MYQGDQGSRGTLHKTGLYFMGIYVLREEREQYRAEFVEEVMKILRETKDMTTEEFAQYKSDRAQASKAASKAMEKGNVTEAKAEETESEPEAEEKVDDASDRSRYQRSWIMRLSVALGSKEGR